MKYDFTELDQYDYIDDDYFEKAVSEYSLLIGEFFMYFSYLEHELEVAIAEFINNRSHDIGYLVMTEINRMRNKIDLFYKCYKMFECMGSGKKSVQLEKINKALKSINDFRNNLAHAKWNSIKEDGTVRVKIENDKSIGIIKFKNIVIKPKDIRLMIKEINRLVDEIYEYKEKVFRISLS